MRDFLRRAWFCFTSYHLCSLHFISYRFATLDFTTLISAVCTPKKTHTHRLCSRNSYLFLSWHWRVKSNLAVKMSFGFTHFPYNLRTNPMVKRWNYLAHIWCKECDFFVCCLFSVVFFTFFIILNFQAFSFKTNIRFTSFIFVLVFLFPFSRFSFKDDIFISVLRDGLVRGW